MWITSLSVGINFASSNRLVLKTREPSHQLIHLHSPVFPGECTITAPCDHWALCSCCSSSTVFLSATWESCRRRGVNWRTQLSCWAQRIQCHPLQSQSPKNRFCPFLSACCYLRSQWSPLSEESRRILLTTIIQLHPFNKTFPFQKGRPKQERALDHYWDSMSLLTDSAYSILVLIH